MRSSRRSQIVKIDQLESRRLFVAGALDTSFSSDGILTHSFGTAQVGADAIVQPDGKVVIVGSTNASGQLTDAFIARYNANGSTDTGFGVSAIRTFSFGATEDIATSVARQSDGKLVVAGLTGEDTDFDMFVARFTTAGALDTTFSGDGKLTIDFGGTIDAATSVLVDTDGKIYVVGTSAGSSTGVGVGIARVTTTGTLDTSFSGDGRIIDAPGILTQTGRFAGRAVLDSSRRLVVAITDFSASIDFSGNVTLLGSSMGVARYSNTGALDTTFSSDGRAFAVYGRTIEIATSVAIDLRTGKIVLGGTTANGTAEVGASLPNGLVKIKAATRANFAISRFKVGGGLDSTFSSDGLFQVDFGSTLLDGCSDIVVDASGRVTAGGGSQVRLGSADFAVARISPGGALDSSFDGDGRRTIDLGGSEGFLGMTIETDGDTLLVGAARSGRARSKVAAIKLLDE